MKAKFSIDFENTAEMLDFVNRLGRNSAETNLQTVLERIEQMANTQIADLIASMQGNFDSLNAEQARAVAALDRVLAMQADMPARIQAAVDAAMANGVDEAQLAALTALGAQVQAEVAEARAEADRLEAAAPAPANPTPSPVPTPPAPPVVDEVPPADGGVVPPSDGGSDTTGGGAPVPTPGA